MAATPLAEISVAVIGDLEEKGVVSLAENSAAKVESQTHEQGVEAAPWSLSATSPNPTWSPPVTFPSDTRKKTQTPWSIVVDCRNNERTRRVLSFLSFFSSYTRRHREMATLSTTTSPVPITLSPLAVGTSTSGWYSASLADKAVSACLTRLLPNN